jgi:hypothetical protein
MRDRRGWTKIKPGRPLSPADQPAVDDQRMTVHKGRIVTGKPHGRLGDVLGEPAGVVEQTVESAKSFDGRVDCRADLGFATDIRMNIGGA